VWLAFILPLHFCIDNDVLSPYGSDYGSYKNNMDHYENHRLHHKTWLSIRHGTILPYRKIGKTVDVPTNRPSRASRLASVYGPPMYHPDQRDRLNVFFMASLPQNLDLAEDINLFDQVTQLGTQT
jgi:hypothetical protein